MRNLEQIGIKKTWDYRLGDWFGNSTYSGYQVFRYVTHNISDLLKRSLFQYKSGKKIVCEKDFKKCLKVREIGHRTYGRCFETEVNIEEQDTIFFVDIQIKRPIYIFFNLPNLFFNEDSRSKFQVDVGQDLFLDATYEILQNNFKEHCLKYPKTFNGSYDHCKIKEIERRIVSEFGCTTPFINKPTLTDKLCTGKKALNASQSFMNYANMLMPSCPDPCINMLTTFGIPLTSLNGNDKVGRVRLYFKNIIKFTADFVSYNSLRLRVR